MFIRINWLIYRAFTGTQFATCCYAIDCENLFTYSSSRLSAKRIFATILPTMSGTEKRDLLTGRAPKNRPGSENTLLGML